MGWRGIGVCLMGVFLMASGSDAEVPKLIRYQGQAIDSKGVPLEGPYDLTFRLYMAETAGTVVWEETQPAVQMAGGHFSVLLGQVQGLGGIDWTQPLWLSVQVNQDAELTPRQRITSVPLAIRAESAEKLTQPLTPTLIAPQGSGSGLDADTVDGQHARDLLNRANHTGTQSASTITGTLAPSVISPQGSGSGLDADLLDGKNSSQFATNPHLHQCTTRMGLPSGQNGTGFCSQFGEWCVTGIGGSGQSIHPCTQTNPGFGDWGAICCR